VIASNVRAQARVLRKGSGGVYDLTSGKATMMEV